MEGYIMETNLHNLARLAQKDFLVWLKNFKRNAESNPQL
jgi:hypothetical protein